MAYVWRLLRVYGDDTRTLRGSMYAHKSRDLRVTHHTHNRERCEKGNTNYNCHRIIKQSVCAQHTMHAAQVRIIAALYIYLILRNYRTIMYYYNVDYNFYYSRDHYCLVQLMRKSYRPIVVGLRENGLLLRMSRAMAPG